MLQKKKKKKKKKKVFFLSKFKKKSFQCFFFLKRTKKKKPFFICISRYDPDTGAEEAGWETSQQLIAVIRNKGPVEEVQKVLDGLSTPLRGELANDEMAPPLNELQIQVFVQTVLYLGSKSFSHSFAGITKFLKIFESLVVCGEEAQMLVLKEMHNVWRSHQQMMVVLVDKFLRTKVVQCATVANWVFSKEMADDFTK